MRQRLWVFLIDNTQYGCFNGRGDAITYVEKTDKVESGGESVLTSGKSVSGKYIKDIAVESLSVGLFHIAMRNRWIDILERWISINPPNMAIIAIKFNHFALLKYLVDKTSAVKLSDLPADFRSLDADDQAGQLYYYVSVVRKGNWEMFKYLHDHECPIAVSEYQVVVAEAIRLKHYHILEFVSKLNSSRYQRALTQPGYTDDIALWRWYRGICKHLHLFCNLVPIVKTVQDAQAVISAQGSADLSILHAAANQANLEAFTYLWQH
ncbi:hypothetical protein HDU76_009857 [Blyttiomyces sp. JEL0837]|nr:hypothetical protein HDU76_009857 [Blyttiomyces sp. JEL0837]